MIKKQSSIELLQKYGLLMVLSLAALLRMWFFTGISSADDIAIADFAMQVMSEGPYIPMTHYGSRLAMIYPLAGVFSVFGIGEIQMALLPLLASMGTMYLTYLLARIYFSPNIALLALGILAVFPLDVFFATRFVPDSYFSFFMTAAVFAALKAYDGETKSIVWALAAGLIWGLGYLVKIEAAFLLFPLLYLAFQNLNQKLVSIAIAFGCFLIVGGENLVYWYHTGEILHRLNAIASSSVINWNTEYSFTQLWVFPKAWFLTPYLFGVHYYLLFIGFTWWVFKRPNHLTLFVVWAGAFLVWLQFGFNPFESTPSFKSHLSRYCVNLSAPTAIIVAAVLGEFLKTSKKVSTSVLVGIFALSVTLMQFNVLSNEREVASKRALEEFSSIYSGNSSASPIYADNGTLALGRFLHKNEPVGEAIVSFQRHNFEKAVTSVVQASEMDGFLILNREFVRHRKNRYFMEGLDEETLAESCKKILSIDNPSPKASYWVAGLIRGVLLLIPLQSFREKAENTVGSLLADNDAVVYDCRIAP